MTLQNIGMQFMLIWNLVVIAVADGSMSEETFIHPYQKFATGDTKYQHQIYFPSKLKCSAYCDKAITCRSFAYHRQSGACTICTKIMLENGNKVYVKKSRLVTPEDMGYVDDSSFRMWYRVNTQAETWQDATDICTNEGGHQIFLPNSSLQSWMIQMMGNDYPSIDTWYCDGNDLDDDTVYRNYKNEIMIWGAWASGEPSRSVGSSGTEQCVMCRISDAKWNDIECAVPKPFICVIDI